MDNFFDATGLQGENYADSWIDLKGNRYKVARNHGIQGDNTQLKHGFETHFKSEGWGRNNIFYANVLELTSSSYGFHIYTNDANHGNIVCANNQVTGAGLGVANIPLTGKPLNQSGVVTTDSRVRLTQTHALTAVQTIWLPLINTSPCG
jgi:hypothetical protein